MSCNLKRVRVEIDFEIHVVHDRSSVIRAGCARISDSNLGSECDNASRAAEIFDGMNLVPLCGLGAAQSVHHSAAEVVRLRAALHLDLIRPLTVVRSRQFDQNVDLRVLRDRDVETVRKITIVRVERLVRIPDSQSPSAVVPVFERWWLSSCRSMA